MPSVAVADPVDTLESHGCLGCHSVDGSSRVGPTFAGIADLHDDAYLRRAILDPEADVVGNVAMPNLGLDEATADELVEALHAIQATDPPFESLWPLIAACALFVGLHFLLSGPLREPMVGKLGFGRFTGVYSALVGLPFAAIFYGWSVAPFVAVWNPPIFTVHLAVTLNLIALVFLVAGYSTPGPTMAGVKNSGVHGVLTITRHPALWGFGLWALAHLGANGDAASIILFASIVILSFGGMLHIDARRRRSDSHWPDFEAQTSIVPFAAVIQKRTKLSLKGLWWRLLIAVVIYATILAWSHEWLTGVSPIPVEMRRAMGMG